MAKKQTFDLNKSALFGDMKDEEIRERVSKKPGRPINENLVREHTAQKGLTPDLMRVTLIASVDQIETLKNYAYTERKKLKDIVNEAFTEYIETHVDEENLLIRPDDWR